MFLITSSLFQFHKGTIRTVYLGLFGEKHFHFNSIKVQLERYAALKKLSVAHQFQFHKGTIRTVFLANLTAKSKVISIP